ncbi:hypothetical protein OG345_40310 (plasmid) [Streptomyces sp. NBC_01220]|uniref:hypothetical protein n=1 Tax=Streptomyces sp. NBC_01220 TaxID=2903781 RepID=UPI00352D4C5A|nr:hypothetical protein OG345_40310 [Streptomyces sp. NBC_01220]
MMMETYDTLLTSVSGIVAVRDFGTEDQPSVESMEEFYFTPGNLLIAARPDFEGDIAVHVSVGGEMPSAMRQVLEKIMNFKSGILSVSAPEYPDEESLRLPCAGYWKVRAFVCGSPNPDRVVLILNEL